MEALIGGLIGGFGNTKAARTSTSSSSGTSSSTPSYTPGQTDLQASLAGYLGNLLTPGTTSPAVTAQKNQSADTINKTYAGLGDRMNKFLAARGFGKSGKVGQAALQTELGRSAAIAGNDANYGAEQLNLQQSAASDALKMAFANPTTTNAFSQQGSQTAAGSAFASALAGAFGGLMGDVSLGGV